MRTSALALMAALALAPTGARAQAREDGNPQLRNVCRLATQILAKGRPEPHYDWAVDVIASCDRSAGEALSSVWSRPADLAADLERFTRASYLTRDGRILAAVLPVASDARRAAPQRVAALLVIASYLEPRVAFSLADLDPASTVVASSISHSGQVDGSEAVSPADLQAGRELLTRLATSPDTTVAYAARKLIRAIR